MFRKLTGGEGPAEPVGHGETAGASTDDDEIVLAAELRDLTLDLGMQRSVHGRRSGECHGGDTQSRTHSVAPCQVVETRLTDIIWEDIPEGALLFYRSLPVHCQCRSRCIAA